MITRYILEDIVYDSKTQPCSQKYMHDDKSQIVCAKKDYYFFPFLCVHQRLVSQQSAQSRTWS